MSTDASGSRPITVHAQYPDVRGTNCAYRQEVTIGRGDECDVTVEHGKVSRVHARLQFDEGQWWIVDADSTNGTYRNGEALDQAPVAETEEVQLARNGPTLSFEVGSNASVSQERPAEKQSATDQGMALRRDADQETEDQSAEDALLADQTGESQETEEQSTEAPSIEDPSGVPQAAEEHMSEDQETEDGADEDRASENRADEDRADENRAGEDRADEDQSPSDEADEAPDSSGDAPFSSSSSASPAPSPGQSVSQYARHYFEDIEAQDAGEHTQMIQKAYQKKRAQQRRKYLGALAGVLVLCILLGGYAVLQHVRNNRLQEQAEKVFRGMKKQEVLIAKLKRSIEASGNASLEKRLAELEEQRRQQRSRYIGHVEELGLHRNLSEKERVIYRVARMFRESEFQIPAGFVRRVKKKIENYWKGPGRDGLVRAIKRAERKGYTSFIVKELQKHGLPPEFFYMALQESRFDIQAVGPETRWGIAKGIWQFIPSTAREYDLKLGPRVNQRVFDPQDQRHDFEASTKAAAEYLQTIYSTRAQASGLLVVASYNWGEHRVVSKMKKLPGPQNIPDAALQGIPDDPSSRNYWKFLTTYEDRMPEETKDYVLKIFSAAVIGQAPELFGFSFENPLQEHIETATPQTAAHENKSSRPINAQLK